MKIHVKNNYLYTENEKFRCSIGLGGLTEKKIEGDHCTPTGNFKFTKIYYRADKLGKIDFSISSAQISPDDGWCDDPKNKHYNKLIKFPFRWRAEKLYRSDNTYNIVVVLDYNMKPIVKGKGSAVFIHLSKNNYSPTLGCISLNLKDLYLLLRLIKKRVYLKIN